MVNVLLTVSTLKRVNFQPSVNIYSKHKHSHRHQCLRSLGLYMVAYKRICRIPTCLTCWSSHIQMHTVNSWLKNSTFDFCCKFKSPSSISNWNSRKTKTCINNSKLVIYWYIVYVLTFELVGQCDFFWQYSIYHLGNGRIDMCGWCSMMFSHQRRRFITTCCLLKLRSTHIFVLAVIMEWCILWQWILFLYLHFTFPYCSCPLNSVFFILVHFSFSWFSSIDWQNSVAAFTLSCIVS